MTRLQIDLVGELGDFTLSATFDAPLRGVTALFGPSGCGKTSILRAVAGLAPSITGSVILGDAVWQDDNLNLPAHKRPVGYVFQEASLFPHLSVEGNIRYGQKRARGTAKDENQEADLFELLGVSKLLSRSPADLSGGEKQRVAIARALLTSPEILLMDEPLSALDQDSKGEILPYLEELQATLEIPILYVSHDFREVERLADHLILIKEGEAVASGPLPYLITDPALPFMKRSDTAAVMTAVVAGYDESYDLTEMKVGSTILKVPGVAGKIGQQKRIRITASDVGLSLSTDTTGMSYLNHPRAVIHDLTPIDNARVMVHMRLGSGGDKADLLSAITRKSAEDMQLESGRSVTALIKSISFVDG